jgi:pentatricopeptide repeat protein
MRGMLALAAAAGLAAGVAGAQVRNQDAAGNLAATVDPGCIAVGQAGATLSPPDLGLGVQACARAGDWDQAVELYILMQLRAVYDIARVADISAHQAEDVLSMQVTESLPRGGQARLQAAFEQFGETGSPRHKAFCRAVKAGGPPQHDPAWMVRHGMGAFLGEGGDGLVPGFRPRAAWTAVLRDYMKC